MPFRADDYGADVSRLLALDGGGSRLMPLAEGTCSSEQARRLLKKAQAKELFTDACAPEAALSGLWLYFSCLEESHQLSQDIPTPEGSFWHGIMHRQEPDAGNSAYWFRRVGRHQVFEALAEEAAAIAGRHADAGWKPANPWNPFSFIEFCESARRRPGSSAEQCALEMQLAEWQLLFDHCARPRL